MKDPSATAELDRSSQRWSFHGGLLDVGGVVQPVTVPLSPHQCKLAGLTLANEGSDPIPPPPGLNQSPAVPPPALMPPPSTVPRGSAQSGCSNHARIHRT